MNNLGIRGKYFINPVNTDYFLNEHNQFLQENPEFETIDDCKTKILTTLNKDFEKDVFVLSPTEKYIRLKCIY